MHWTTERLNHYLGHRIVRMRHHVTPDVLRPTVRRRFKNVIGRHRPRRTRPHPLGMILSLTALGAVVGLACSAGAILPLWLILH